ncbi:MAG: Lrp/AsnC family transcriptional regulator [Candidatus Woesearchaeota archaeon]
MVDNTDLRLLYELNWNCRQTHTSLGKKLRISKQVVSYRIAQLEKNQIIQSYHALIDWRKLGYNSIRVYIKWHRISPEEEKKIYDEIKKNPFFMWTVKFEGEFDLGLYMWVKEVPEFSQKWFSFLAKYKKFILRYEIYESVNMVHYPMKVLVENSKNDEKILGEGNKVEYDSIDDEIMKVLTENASTSLVELAKRIKLTPKAALYRLRKLEKNKIILGYNALIDTDKLGYRFYKIDFYLNDFSRIKEMNEFAKQHKNIVYRMRTIGGPDFEIEVMVKDVTEMNQLVAEIRRRFSECIEYSRFHRFEYTIKQVYLPGE